MLARRNDETSRVVIPSTVCFFCVPELPRTSSNQYLQAIDFLYNVQHDCPLANCTASGKQPLMQERVESGLSKTYIEHQPIDRFVINTHAFHNAHYLRAILPRALVAPIPLYENRVEKHHEISRNLQMTQDSKRIAAKARAASKKQAIDIRETAASGPSNKRTRMEFETDQVEVNHT